MINKFQFFFLFLVFFTVVVGADRLVLNGDFANKIGTYQLAVLCTCFKDFDLNFSVFKTYDLNI